MRNINEINRMNIFLILPNQLFEESILHIKNNNYDKIIIYEDPHYFSAEIKPNKIKIAYLRACMKYYYDNMIKEGITNIYYYECCNNNKEIFNARDNYYCYEITDYKLLNKYKKINLKIFEMETPMFILNKKDLDTYNKKNSFSHSSLYKLSKTKLKILENIENKDVYNRSNPKIEVPLENKNYINKDNKEYYEEAIKYSNKYLFNKHIGDPTLDNIKIYPINFKNAYEAYENYIKYNINNFGLYQDVIQDNNPFIYHSIISPMLNNGLLVPLKLINIIKKYEYKIPINSYEGFIRQIIGWREYMRYLYIYKYEEIIKSNTFNNNKKLNNNWYSGTTGLLIIDNEIKKAISYGYSHHIVRLMIFLNFMILNEIRPQDIYKWFMEIISIDAYDWVMVSNIYVMGYFSKIGMRRPYLSSSNYLLKMSNYKKDNTWNIIWDNSYKKYVKDKNISFYLRTIK